VAVRWQACTDRYCLPPASETLAVPLAVQAGRAIAATAMSLAAASPAARAPALAPTQPAAPGSAASVPAPRPTAAPAVEGARPVSIRSTDRAAQLRFLALAAGMGLLALLTPCILPLVPITVSFLSRDGDAPRARGRWVRPASYATGIVLTFTVLGALVSALLGAGGMVRLAASPVVNVSIALLFVAFGANLLGLWALRLPAGLATRLLRVGATGEGGALSVATAFLMGVAFAVTSFTCTAPFVGSLLVLAAQGERSWPLAGLAVYALAFALPFVILAGVPRLFRWLPRSGPWMVTLEGVLGIVEIAMAVKFLSNADLVLGWGVLRREVVIALWIAALALVALVLAGIVPLPGAGRPARRAPGRVLAAVPGVGALWLATGLRGARLGEIEAYLPPLDAGMHAASTSMLGAEPSVRDDELPWRRDDYEGALAQATREGRPLLVDFTGYTCTNCRWMEANMFPRPAVRAQLERFVRVRLYTDGLGEPYARQQAMQQARFGTVALPYYAVLAPDGTPRATFLGMTRDTREFVGFLTRWSSR
jgi:thiol:disulfide interchange protein DsbD